MTSLIILAFKNRITMATNMILSISNFITKFEFRYNIIKHVLAKKSLSIYFNINKYPQNVKTNSEIWNSVVGNEIVRFIVILKSRRTNRVNWLERASQQRPTSKCHRYESKRCTETFERKSVPRERKCSPRTISIRGFYLTSFARFINYSADCSIRRGRLWLKCFVNYKYD